MARVVYWCIPKSPYYLNFTQPEPLIKDINALKESIVTTAPESDFVKCPAVHNHVRNTFVIRSPIDLTFISDGKEVLTKNYNQEIFDNLFIIRDVPSGFLSLTITDAFFFTEEDCEMTLTGAYLSNNDASKYLSVLPGVFNISKWFRNIDFACFIREFNKEINIKQGDPLMYLKFNSKEPIVFKKFYYTKEIAEISSIVIKQKVFQKEKSINTYLETVYNLFTKSKIKNRLLVEIKRNLME